MLIKPSEKVPLTMTRVMEIFKEAGLPDGVLNLVHGTADSMLFDSYWSNNRLQPFLPFAITQTSKLLLLLALLV